MTSPRLTARFWGVRGSTPVPRAAMLGYGGNTPCLEVQVPDGDLVILDAGTGLRGLGLAAPQAPRRIHLFLTHFHRDHLEGLPFFGPLYREETRLSIYASGRWGSPEKVLNASMGCPYFPLGLAETPARKQYCEIDGAAVRIDALVVQPFPLHHPQGALGYRLEVNGATLVYATDWEPGNRELDERLRVHTRHADALICDAHYTPEEYARHVGWGHGSWLDAVALATDADVRRLVLFHHAPSRTDDEIDTILSQARERFPLTDAAREGTTVDV